jgi:hypothetical protein
MRPAPPTPTPTVTRQVIEQLGLVTTDATGQPVFDFSALTSALHERFEDYVARNGGRGGAAEAAAAAAVRAALRYAQQVRRAWCW